VDHIKELYAADSDFAEAKDYQACMALLDAPFRRRLIQGEVKDKPINLAHLALASLIKNGKIDRVITTNFDSLLTRACGLLGVEVAVYDVDALASPHFEVHDIGMPAIFYVHGQYYGFSQRNAPDDYNPAHTKNLYELIAQLSITHTWIVAGYSGENDPSAEALISQDTFRSGLFWVGYLDCAPCESIRAKLFLPAKNAFNFPGYDADVFFSLLARASGCDPMRLLQNPFSHLASIFREIGFLKGSTEDNERTNSLFQVKQAIQQYERLTGSPQERWRSEERLCVPDPHPGLLFTLPIFRCIGDHGFNSVAELAESVGNRDFRKRAFETNWGPPILAIEHHLSQLQHCWIACTPQISKEDYAAIEGVVAFIARNAPSLVTCHQVALDNPNSILAVQQAIKGIYDIELKEANLSAQDLIADITGGLSTITGGIVLATLDEDRPIEYLTQGVRLVQDGRVLTPQEIRDRQLLVAIHTTGEMVRDVFLRAS
jgi:hypothetical protein